MQASDQACLVRIFAVHEMPTNNTSQIEAVPPSSGLLSV